MAETVLVIGATGNIGISAVIAALRSKRNVLAVVRNQNSADKLIKHVGTSEGITFTEADVAADNGVMSVVEQVRAGKLPAFHHVWASIGAEYAADPLTAIKTDRLERNFAAAVYGNFYAYRDTIPYLLEQKYPKSTWTICTGSQGDLGFYALPAMTQGALYSMCMSGARENEKTNIRFNEIYLSFRVEVDEDAIAHKVTKASDFSNVYQLLLDDEAVRSSRIRVDDYSEDLKKLKYTKKF